MRFSVIFLLLLFIYGGCEEPKPENAQQQAIQNLLNPPEPQTENTMDAYFEACLNGDLNFVQKAVEGGIAVNTPNENGSTGMMLAAFNGHNQVVSYLLESGADVNHLDVNNRTALMYASSGPAVETVKVLLDAGAKINQADGVEGFTAAMFAASEGQIHVFKLLLDAGADISLKDIDGESARDFAQNGGHTEIVNLIDSK